MTARQVDSKKEGNTAKKTHVLRTESSGPLSLLPGCGGSGRVGRQKTPGDLGTDSSRGIHTSRLHGGGKAPVSATPLLG